VLLLGACTPGNAPSPQRHVFEIVMENHSPAEALTGPFTASLAEAYGVAANYMAITHPSVPNYLALTSGQTWGVTDDSYHNLPRADLGSQLSAHSVTWRAYMDGLTDQGCIDSPLPYDPGHNPFAFYGGGCPSNVVPLTALRADLAGNTPLFTWISPDDCHNGHSCPVSTADDWLRETVTLITQSDAWRSNGVLFITWDEDDGRGDNHVLTLVVAPGRVHRVSEQPYNHYSLLATIQDLLGVGRQAGTVNAGAMQDLVGS
jgi:phosphatidylinositol-3-phosphatase